jgi:hypothetical protein
LVVSSLTKLSSTSMTLSVASGRRRKRRRRRRRREEGVR